MVELTPYKQDRDLLIRILKDAGCVVRQNSVRCAFHSEGPEKHPSGSIFQKDGIWLYRCFGCNCSGDCIKWLAIANNKSDEDVIEHLGKTGELLGVGAFTPQIRPTPKPRRIDYEAIERDNRRWIANADNKWLKEVAEDLGVNYTVLQLYGAGRHEFTEDGQVFPCITLPMYDTIGVCGVRFRSMTGKKKSRYGSKSGLFLPQPAPFRSCLWITEGCTDPIAMASLGLWSIGLPAALQGIDIAKWYVETKTPQATVVVKDANAVGQASGARLCDALNGLTMIKSITAPQGYGDVREWIKAKRLTNTDADIKSWLVREAGSAREM